MRDRIIANPTAEAAIAEIDFNKKRKKSRKPIPILDHVDVAPLSKFDDPSSHKGRRRLLRDLNRSLSSTPKDNQAERNRLKREIKDLEQRQFVSRVSTNEVVEAVAKRRLPKKWRPL